MSSKDLKVKQIKGVSIKDLQVLSDLEGSDFWDDLHRLFETKIYNLIVDIQRLPAADPNLGVKKAFYDGQISALRKFDKQVREADKELDKLEK